VKTIRGPDLKNFQDFETWTLDIGESPALLCDCFTQNSSLIFPPCNQLPYRKNYTGVVVVVVVVVVVFLVVVVVKVAVAFVVVVAVVMVVVVVLLLLLLVVVVVVVVVVAVVVVVVVRQCRNTDC
jgi:hypothetical protein